MNNTLLLIMLAVSSMEMAICLGCSMILVQFRRQTWDCPRQVLTFLTLFCGVMAFYRVIDIVQSPLDNGFTEVLPPANVLLVLCTQIFLYFYPRTLLNPGWLSWKNRGVYWILAPLALVAAAYLLYIGHWTRLGSFQDIVDNMRRGDVLLRGITVDLMVPYSILFLFLPYNWRRSGATLGWIRLYTVGVVGFCVLHITYFFTGILVLRIIQQLWEIVFIAITCDYELRDRFIPAAGAPAEGQPAPEEDPQQPASRGQQWGETALWDRVQKLLEQDQVWRNPDLTLPMMAQFCGTNITYLSNAFKEHAGTGFNTYINQLRIRSITDALRQNPSQDIQQLCYNAGYRSRTTAWRNFKEITGVTPTEYKQSLQ